MDQQKIDAVRARLRASRIAKTEAVPPDETQTGGPGDLIRNPLGLATGVGTSVSDVATSAVQGIQNAADGFLDTTRTTSEEKPGTRTATPYWQKKKKGEGLGETEETDKSIRTLLTDRRRRMGQDCPIAKAEDDSDLSPEGVQARARAKVEQGRSALRDDIDRMNTPRTRSRTDDASAVLERCRGMTIGDMIDKDMFDELAAISDHMKRRGAEDIDRVKQEEGRGRYR